ncbi:sodium-dependent transporter [Caloramator australicus]|uniref:Transporter n=1 Tax=Caloramator australicus RC3 TaxID=857293 RepID=I7K6N7_9CLOT|nr:sodium-dependent transporter [Caloramator australicus]CCJ33209.1 sodium transporter family protein [Caloramator australicus RC3]
MKREKFSSSLAVFLATLGSAIGLGNIWRFPYVTGMNGGGAFLFVYLFCVLLVGIPVMISEFFIGRKTRSNPVIAFEKLGGRKWSIVGYMGIIASLLIMFFYSAVAGWVYSYTFKSLMGKFNGATLESSKDIFINTITNPKGVILWQLTALLVVAIILTMGVKGGIERATKILMPVLFVLILICDIRALTLENSLEGIKFLFAVDFSKLKSSSILTALGLSFFKLSLGVGAMITYASYFTDDDNLMSTSLKVALSDTLISLLAGIAIFPTVFAFKMEPSYGPGLLFITIPLIFSKLPFGNVLLFMFFLLTSIAATTAMLSLVEVPVAYLMEVKKIGRIKSVLMVTCIIALFGSLAALSVEGNVLSNVKLLGKSVFDIFDYLSSNILLPLGGILISAFVGYFVRREEVIIEITNKMRIKNVNPLKIYLLVLKYATPILIGIIFINSIF